MAASTDTVPVRRANSPLRFSLRFLLLAVTVFAIGFPIWYRWPYEEVDDQQSANPVLRSTTTWQREWGGGRSRIAQSKYFQGNRMRLETFRGETRHGPYEISSRDGSREVGQFDDGKKDGLWQIFDSQGKMTESISWKLGRLDGEMTRVGRDGSARVWTFAGGRLLTIDGRAAESYWPAVAAAKRNVPPELKAALHEDAIRPNFRGTPLRDVVAFLAPSRETLVFIDRQHVEETRPITIDCEGTDLYSCLTMIAQEYGLACDVRHGCVWFTSPDSALDWKDSTGVEALTPSPGSDWAKAWNDGASLTVTGQSLLNAIELFAEQLAVDIDTAAVAPLAKEDPDRFLVTIHTNKLLRYQDLLGLLLESSRCRCELRGETLVILPSE